MIKQVWKQHLELKDEYGAEVTVLTMGLPKAEEVLREAMAMGADNGILGNRPCTWWC